METTVRVEEILLSIREGFRGGISRRIRDPSVSDAFRAVAGSIFERLRAGWEETQSELERGAKGKEVIYLSLEFLVGRSLQNAACNLRLEDHYRKALMDLGMDLEAIREEEFDPGLGNGGLGRLASCFMDSMATMALPAWGYGLRYRFGMFEQVLEGGMQRERPDPWLQRGNPWEVRRDDIRYPVHFYGSVVSHNSTCGGTCYQWQPGETVLAVAYDTPIPGYGTSHTNTMRLWRSEALQGFHLEPFNQGKHLEAFEEGVYAEAITSVLYPNDTTYDGKVLRLKQQYLLVSATLQDILHRLRVIQGVPMSRIANRVVLQLNDTHPALAVPELMRLLLDGPERLGWEEAWTIVTSVLNYTNHTILPEALEKWHVPLLEKLLPRHMQIIYEINHRHLQAVCALDSPDLERMARLSIIEESQPKAVRMAMLAAVASRRINGVAHLHSRLVRSRLFPDLAHLHPEKFVSITNGVSPRRWILVANPSLAKLLDTEFPDRSWLENAQRLRDLDCKASDPDFQAAWRECKRENKRRLACYISRRYGGHVMVDAMFDVQAKRIHEYKRQLLNILGVIYRYRQILDHGTREHSPKACKPHYLNPRLVLLAGKAAPGYEAAKQIIRLALSVSRTINSDEATAGLLQVLFLANYNVSLAELMVPAADVSQHISTAGMEASGTGNMKFAMNGGLLLATVDGANIEIAEASGGAAVTTFGATEDEVLSFREGHPDSVGTPDPRLRQVLEMIDAGLFGPPETYRNLLAPVRKGNDYFMVARDFASYLDAQKRVDDLYVQEKEWTRRSIKTAASMGTFSSDRAVLQYAQKVWDACPGE